MPQSEEVKKAFVFPYYRDGELVNAKYRSGKKEFRSEVGAERILYGLDDVKEGDTPVILVEGEMDKLSLWEAGFRNCVSVPDGAPHVNTKDYASKFDFLNDDRLQGKQFILAGDNDAPGQKLQEELARRLGKEVCSRVTWPEGCKDANDVLKEYGKKILAECIEHAEPYPIVGTYTTGDLSEQLFDLYDNGLEKGVSTGWDSLDKHYLIRPGCFSVLTGIPGSGKSNWLDAMMVNIAKKHGWRFAIFSPENQPLEDHMSRIMEKYVGAPFRDGPNMRMTRDELENATEWAKEHFQWILPEDDHEWTLEKILDTARGLVRRYGIRGLVIDPWNELETQRGEFSETEFIGLCLKRARQFARRYGIHLWIVAHPAKMYRDKSGAYPVPSLWDISGSAHWRNKSDTGVVIYRDLADPESKVVEIHVQKQRFRQDGGMGMSTLTYRHTTGSYIDHQ
jgi:twinkle protein